MTWCSHRKGVNEGLSAAAALPAAIKADVLLLLLLLLLLSHLLSPLPPPFHSVRLVLEGVRQENIVVGVGGVWGGVMCVCGVCRIWWGRLQISSATPAVITDRCALYACASRVLTLLHNTCSAAEDTRECDPNPPSPHWMRDRRSGSVPWCCPSGTWLPVGKSRRGRRVFFKWLLSSLI